MAATPDELVALRATLAGKDAFTRYGIDRPPFLSTLTFKVGKSKEGRDVLLVRSTDAIPEPFVTFLVEVNWSRGRLMREYTVLLDPPVYTPGEKASTAAPVAAPVTAPAPPPEPVRKPAPVAANPLSSTTEEKPTAVPLPGTSAAGILGPHSACQARSGSARPVGGASADLRGGRSCQRRQLSGCQGRYLEQDRPQFACRIAARNG